jgi:hypothetical protein
MAGNMLEYDYTPVTVEFIKGENTDEPWLRNVLKIEPKDEKIILTYQDIGHDGVTISLSCFIEDWKDLFPRIVEERLYLARSGGENPGELVSPKSLKISGTLNPLVNMIIYAFCSRSAAHFSLKLIDCDSADLARFLDRNGNLHHVTAVKYAKLLDGYMERAFLRMKYLVSEQGPRLSEILKEARSKIAEYEERGRDIQEGITRSGNKVAFEEGRFWVVEVHNAEYFDNIYEPAQYAIIDLEDPYMNGGDKLAVVAVGKENSNGFEFSLTFSHVEWEFDCAALAEAPGRAFSAMESYTDMVS